MKKAIGYIRISDEDQSHFSLEGQQEYIINYCARERLELIEMYIDDGQSAKNFDRANWVQLEKFIKQNHKMVDHLIVMKFDRFSRNLPEALVMIEKFEKKLSIHIDSVMEPIKLPRESPYYFQLRAQILLNAHVELLVIRDRTKFGQFQGAKQGRFLSTAPTGYKNARDNEDKPILVVDQVKAEHIKDIYRLFLIGMTIKEIHRYVANKGFKLNGNSVIMRILTSPVYAGMIKVPAYQDEQERLVKGLQQPIIDEATWWKVQNKLKGRSGQPKNFLNEAVPLRGTLHCSCGKLLTAGNSKGKTKYYWYYVCLTDKINLNANKLHKQFEEVLELLSFPGHYIDHLTDQIKNNLADEISNNKGLLQQKRKQLEDVMERLNSLEKKYLNDKVNEDFYNRWNTKLQDEKHEVLQTISELQAPAAAIWNNYLQELNKLNDINYLYSLATLSQKQAFVKLVFNNQLYYKDGAYRTPYILPVFHAKSLKLKEKGLLFIEQPLLENGENPVRAPDRN